jgi:signal transduction histidine kinase/DNA-binding response OmpR family regulator
MEDKSGVLWIGTQTAGLNKFDRKTENFTLQGDRKGIQWIIEDKSGTLWFGGFSGLEKLKYKTGEYSNYWHDPGNPSSISNNTINVIHESSFLGKDVIWVGTEGGLNRFDPKGEKFFSYTTQEGLASDMIHGILEDEQDNLWLSTNNGLSRFNPQTETFRNYDVHDGLSSNQFYPGALFKGRDGALFFGGISGLNYFFPDHIKDNTWVPEIVITGFQICNESVTINRNPVMENEDVIFLSKHISATREIVLSYRDNIFSFEFAALDYRSPTKNKYAYQMEGVDPGWVYTDASRRFASYTHLDPGEYIFKVKGSNNDGIWNEEGTSIKIMITPPWWRTNWAYSIYVLLILSMVYGIWRFQTNRLKMKQQMEMEHFEADKLREVDHLKSSFFANISHEFRTPLTLIQGPVKQMLAREFKGNPDEQYRMILRYSKLESGRMTLRVSRTSISQFMKGIVQSFASLAEQKKITLRFKTNDESLMGYVDRDKLEKIVTNLLSNAFKFTPEGGRVEVDLSLRRNMAQARSTKQSLSIDGNEIPTSRRVGTRNDRNWTESIQIKILNSGPGIPPEQLDKIFDRFYQVDESYTKDGEGTGIGLALAKELVEVHHGEILAESELNKGTTLTVWLPIGKEYFKSEEMVKGKPPEGHKGSEISYSGVIEVPEDEARVSLISKSSGGSKSAPLLLIVEDNPDVTAYIRSFMEKDYRIITAENGEVGLKKALKKFPDLIISDVMMPVMDGFEMCHKLKSDENSSHIPVILLTAKADMDSKIEGLEFGADDYVTKPFDARELLARVKNLIEQRKKLHEKFSRMIEIKPGEIAASSMDEQFLKRLLNVFEAHVDESDFSTEDFAREVGMSRSNLHLKLKALTNQPTHEFLRILRLKRAAQLLKKSTGNVTEVAYAVGFNNLSHFTKIFRQQFGQTPSEFANKNRPIETPEK